MHRRVNITLPDETIRLVDSIARKGDRSFLIAEAVRHYIASIGKARLRRPLVIQNDIANRWSPITIVAALSSQVGRIIYPTEVRVDPPEGRLKVSAVVLLNQIRSVG